MVLENSSASPPANFADGAPASDNDPYSSYETSIQRTYHIDTASFPKPIPVIGRLLGFTDGKFNKLLTDRIAMTARGLNRPLTDDEATAIGYWAAKQVAIFSYATPLAWGAAIWRWNNTSSSFRFPFYQPDMTKLDTSVFPTKRFAWFKGPMAYRLWTTSRLSAYACISIPIAQLLLGSYSATVSTVGQLSDKRMKPIIDEIQARAEKKRGGLPGQPGGIGQRPRAPVSTNTQVDDASPTGGMLWEAPVTADDATNTTQSTQPQPSRPRWTPSKSVPTQMPSTDVSQDKAFDPFDDASPTGGQGMTSDTQQATQGSAWERLRRGGGSNSGSSGTGSSQSAWQRQQNERQGGQTEESTAGDSFSISKTEEERSYAKGEAQKEFDARIERERRGGDFSQGNGDQKRW